MTRTLRTLMSDLVDYAGLFPPAGLSMPHAVEAYARALQSEHEWMLGRFIVPASRLTEFEHAAASLLPGTQALSGYRERPGEPWRVSVLQDGDLARDLDRVHAFNDAHEREDQGQARIDMLEIKPKDAGAIDTILDRLTDDLTPFFEFPVNADCRGFVAALAGNPAGAKIRTGGVTCNAFPTPGEVAGFLHACAAAGVAFKATAGLHHPVRASHKVTYDKDAPSCVMHGFLNVFLAAALVRADRLSPDQTQALLADEEPDSFRFSDEIVGWREHLITVTELAHARESFAHSFGSCSFDEPVQDLARLGLLGE